MGNLSKIKSFSKSFYILITLLLVLIPAYYVLYWAFINQLPAKLITVNTHSAPLAPHGLSPELQILGFVASLLPLCSLLYGFINMRKLFSFYKQGIIFSFELVAIFRNTARALMLWVLSSILYESAKSVIFSLGNPPGSRTLEVGFTTGDITALLVGGIVFVIAWVMDEGRILAEESKLTV